MSSTLFYPSIRVSIETIAYVDRGDSCEGGPAENLSMLVKQPQNFHQGNKVLTNIILVTI